ncbi:MAG: CHAT domain-containing tetratricopeptide repeat protein [Cyclobacteriaceae bacterium]
MRNYLICFLIVLKLTSPVFGQQREAELVQAVDNLLLNSQFTEALALLEKESPETSSVLLQNKKAEALTRNGNLEEAETLLRSVLARTELQRDDYLEAITKSNLGFLQLNQGRNDLAEGSLQASIRQFEEARKAESPETAQAFSYLGLVYMSQGKYAQAQEQLHRALSLRQAGKSSNELIAATYNDLGLVYSQTDKDKALDYFEQAGKMYVNLYGNEHPKNAIANINTGIVYRDLELYGDAVNNFETALRIWNAVYSRPHPAKAIALYNLGQTYVKLGDRKSAMAFYERARKMYEDCYGAKHPEVASVLNAIGNLQLADSDFTGALNTYQQALQANVPSFNNNDLKANPALKDYYHGTRLLHTLLFKAQAFESKYLGKSLKFSDLNEALNILTRCDSLIDQLRQHSTNESDKLLLGAMANEVYMDGVRIAYEASLNSLQKESFLRKTFYFAEKSKGAVLLESISESNAKSFAGIPVELLEEENNLKSALTLTAQKLAQKPVPEEEKILGGNSFALKRSYDAFIQKLEDQFPAYFNLKFNSAAPSIEQLQEMLNSKTALLSYFIDEKNSQLYIFLIQDDHFKVLLRPWSAEIDKYMTGLRNGLYFNEVQTFKQSAFALGHTLIPKIPSGISELVILPTGRLGLIPFETLLTRDAEKISDYGSMPFMLKRFSIRYEFSAGLILQKSKKTKPLSSPSIFLCAPVSFSQNPVLADLPGTAREVQEISKLFREKNLTSAAYTHLQADEKQIKSGKLENYNYLHFATHGIVDESNPELSRIFLQSDGNVEDGSLYAGEIYNLHLNADLVTLSACQTGLGKIQKGEGVIGLSRALVYAGSRNIVVSFWNVADESTAILMKDFYQNVLRSPGSPYTTALHDAKLKMLETEPYSAPFYWAPFVLIGF